MYYRTDALALTTSTQPRGGSSPPYVSACLLIHGKPASSESGFSYVTMGQTQNSISPSVFGSHLWLVIPQHDLLVRHYVSN